VRPIRRHAALFAWHEGSTDEHMMQSLRDLLIDELRDLYDAEGQLTKALPRFAEVSSTPVLTEAFRDHITVTEMQIERLAAAFQRLETNSWGKKCKGVQGILADGRKLITQMRGAAPSLRDAALIMAGQRVEHYEIAAYAAAVRHAALLGEDQIAGLLHASLEEEKAADETLSVIADREVNAAAMLAVAV
jgi:ferritin-like metal-binding protein YciE